MIEDVVKHDDGVEEKKNHYHFKDAEMSPFEQQATSDSEQYEASPSNWFAEVQKLVSQPTAIEMGELIAKLYVGSTKAAEDEDVDGAVAYADACYSALKHAKHGTDVRLPRHLWHKIPKHLHKYLNNDET